MQNLKDLDKRYIDCHPWQCLCYGSRIARIGGGAAEVGHLPSRLRTAPAHLSVEQAAVLEISEQIVQPLSLT